MTGSPNDTPTYGTGDLDRIEAALVHDRAPAAAQADPATVGRYQILERIGEGGMGCVYRAQQRAPIERTVALKLIKVGLDSPEFIRRFESERQALAWMDHPHIAKVFDAGADPVSGRPYFVMEYVRGMPITRYCDEHRLNNRLRLELFLQVCDAVAHAHQKMIVHRDLKPSNILVASNNGPSTAHAKVIDFGVAKAIVSEIEQRTLFTESGQIIGTPEYMSPEQARGMVGGDGAGVDTRSDIYSLGVVLYELISGALPFDSRELRGSGIAGLERMICDVDPPRPSTRLSRLSGDDVTKAAEQRQTRREELLRELGTELEWIPLKAMRKDRAARYATANELADDVRNYLAGRPLIAAPESRTYLVKKFLRRHRFGVTATAAMVVLLVAGIIGTTWQAIRAERQRKLADARFNDIREFATNLIVDIHGDVAKLPGSQDAVEKLIKVGLQYLQKLNAESSQDVRVVSDASNGYRYLGDMQGDSKGDRKAALASYQKARELAERALALSPNARSARAAMANVTLKLGDLYLDNGEYQQAQSCFEQSLRISEEIAAGAPEDFVDRFNEVICLARIFSVQVDRQDTAAAAKTCDTVIERSRKLVADFPGEKRASAHLAAVLWDQGQHRLRSGDQPGALSAAREAVKLFEDLAAADPDNVGFARKHAGALESLARIYEQHGDMDDAVAAQSRARQIAATIYGKDSKDVRIRDQLANAELRYAELASRTKRFDEAQTGYDRAIALFNEALANNAKDRHALQMLCYSNASLGDMFARQKRYPEALSRHREVLKTIAPIAQDEPDNFPIAGGLAFGHMRIGRIMLDSGDASGASESARQAIEIQLRVVARDPANVWIARQLIDSQLILGDALMALNQTADARAVLNQAKDLATQLNQKKQLGPTDDILKTLNARLESLPPAP